jgi:predicted permease
MGSIVADVRYSLRRLRNAPMFTLSVVLVLALGIGANAALFSALDRAVLAPLPYGHPDRLALLWEDFSAFGTPRSRVSPGTFADWKQRVHSFEDLAAFGMATRNLTEGGAPEELAGQSVTHNFFSLLGVQPVRGRAFRAEEEAPGHAVVILSDELWRRRFASDPEVLGSTVHLSGEPLTVVGVMPSRFRFVDGDAQFWVPLALSPELRARRNSHFLRVAGRLRPGAPWGEARREMREIADQLAREYPASNDRVGIAVVPLIDELQGDARKALGLLLAAAACVLLMACASVACLLLARATGRRQEIAVRLAIGGSRGRIVQQLLTENLLLALLGGGAGVVVAAWGLRALEPFVPPGLSTFVHLELDTRVFAAAGIVSLGAGLVFGLLPALRLARADLRAFERGPVGGSSWGMRDGLVSAQVAIALVLLVGAGLLLKTLARLRDVRPGFDAERVLTARITPPFPKYEDFQTRTRFFDEVLDRVRALPGALRVGLTSDLPFTSRGNTMSITLESRPSKDLGQDSLFRLVSSDYLETIGAHLVAGRLLDERDRPESTPVVVVNESFARQYWPGGDPLGHRLDTGTGGAKDLWLTVVGVVADIRERGLDLASKPAVYVPYTQARISFFVPSEIAVRTKGEPRALAPLVQKAVWAVDPEQPIVDVQTMRDIADFEVSDRRRMLGLFSAFAALALVLATFGVYAVLAQLVSERRREIGVRMAIGATPAGILRSVLGHSAVLTVIGAAIGLLGAAAASRVLQGVLYDVSPLDPPVFAGVTLLFGLVATLASYVPARRAARLDPASVLRSE